MLEKKFRKSKNGASILVNSQNKHFTKNPKCEFCKKNTVVYFDRNNTWKKQGRHLIDSYPVMDRFFCSLDHMKKGVGYLVLVDGQWRRKNHD